MRLAATGLAIAVVIALVAVGSSPSGLAAPAKDTLVVAIYDEPTTLDARFHTGRVGAIPLAAMYEFLFRYTPKRELVGHLAESWTWEDPRSLRVKLRRGVTFHDGQPLTARDVKYSLEAIANPALRSRQLSYMNEITAVDVVSDQEAIIRTSRPSRSLVRFLTKYGQIAPARSRVPSAEGIDLARTPVGTGPFRFVEYIPGNRLVLERYDRYWGPLPRLRGLTFRTVRDPGTRVVALEARDVDVTLGVPSEARATLRQKGFKVDVTATVATYALNAETTTPPFDNIRVRHAAAHAIDKDALTKLLGPETTVAKSVLGPGVWARHEMTPFLYDPEKAKRLLKEANAESPEIWYVFDPANTDGSTVVPEAVGEYLRRVGFRVRMQAMERGTFNAQVYTQNRKVNMWTWSWGVSSLDPDEIFRREFHSTRGAIWVSSKSLLLDKLIDQAQGELDEKKAAAIYRRVQEIISREAAWIPLYNIVEAIAYRPDVKGIVEWPGGGQYWFDRASF